MEKYSLSEERLELKFIKQLEKLGYKYVKIENEEDLVDNLKNQLEIFNQKELNNKKLSKSEFDKILNHLEKGSIQDKSIKLRDRFELVLDNGDLIYIRFFNSEKWCQNLYQVTHQITIEGKYENRYDVTILINGLPLTQIELKKNGLSLKEVKVLPEPVVCHI
jgi:type I restriction enzyme R subunit